MRRETLLGVVRLRALAVDEAKRTLAECLARETAAQDAVVEADQTMTREADAALDLAAGDDVVEAYARWLPFGRKAADRAAQALDAATEAVGHARNMLDLARAAHRPAEEALVEFDEQSRRATEKRRQDELDDVSAARRAAGAARKSPLHPDGRRGPVGRSAGLFSSDDEAPDEPRRRHHVRRSGPRGR